MFLGSTPWINPSIESLQREFNATYPGSYIKLHIDDAAIVPVFVPAFSLLKDVTHNRKQTIWDLGVLHSQIGKEAIRAVNDHLPGQYSKRQFDSKSARAAYIQALVSDTKQHPFIWESFRPGNLPVGGAKLYYDDVSPTSPVPANSYHSRSRNIVDDSNQSPFLEHFLSTGLPTEFSHQFHHWIQVEEIVQ